MKRASRFMVTGVAAGSGVLLAAAAGWMWVSGLSRSTAGATLSGASLPASDARPAASLHTFLHVNCKHHAHGAAWHKDHGRILGAKSRVVADDDEEPEDQRGRR